MISEAQDIQNDKEAFLISMPCIVKSVNPDLEAKERVVSVEASCEEMDSEGDIILQRALLDSAPGFVAKGDLDIDHLSKVGARYGIKDPDSYIVGRPLSVKSLGNGRTEVVGQIYAGDTFDPVNNKYDEFWKSLINEPDVPWRASIYGFPTDLEKGVGGAERFLVKAMNWTSLAFTRKPVNQALKGETQVITAKSLGMELAKGGYFSSLGEIAIPKQLESLDELYKSYFDHRISGCEHLHGHRSLYHIKQHMIKCEGMSEGTAEIAAHAVMNMVRRAKR